MNHEGQERAPAAQSHLSASGAHASGLAPFASMDAMPSERQARSRRPGERQALSRMTALITGATSGIGAACARRFASHGARLVLVGRRAHRLEALAEELGKITPIHTIELDIRDRRAVQHEFTELPAEFAGLDVLVNNAGVARGLEPAQRADLDDWVTTVETNVMGLLYWTHAVLPGMVARNKGHIINVGSVAGSYPYPGGHVYCGTKAFVHQFSLAMRSDLLGTKVHVTCIEPGKVQSEFAHVRFKDNPARAAAVYADTEPLTPGDIAEVIHWCVTRPTHVNINNIELMPADQAFNPLAVVRRGI